MLMLPYFIMCMYVTATICIMGDYVRYTLKKWQCTNNVGLIFLFLSLGSLKIL